MKKCPFCAEEIQDAAILCRYCNRSVLPAERVPAREPDLVQNLPTNGLAIASLVMGILWIWWFGSILALFLGYAARREIRASKTPQAGDGLATAGIVLGWIGVGFLALSTFGLCAAVFGPHGD